MIKNKTLDFKFEIKQLDEDGTIEGYGAIFGNVDKYNDIIEQGAFRNNLLEKSANEVKMLWQHNSREPIGVWDEIREDSKGLYCKGHILIDTTKGSDVYKMLKGGAISGLSIGYNVVKSSKEEIENSEDIRKLKEVELWEISIVTFPANVLANITSVKSLNSQIDLLIAPIDTVWNEKEAKERIKEFNGLDNKLNISVVDVIDGKVHIVPEAVFSIAEGKSIEELDFSNEEKDRMKEKINVLYSKFRKEFDDNTLISPFEDKKSLIEKWELKEFDKFLKKSSLTNSEIKIFRKRYLELHNKEEVKKIDEKKDDDDEKNKKSLAEIEDNKESPEEKKKEKDIQKTIPAELRERLESVVKDLQNI